jgi:hypothetical protein
MSSLSSFYTAMLHACDIRYIQTNIRNTSCVWRKLHSAATKFVVSACVLFCVSATKKLLIYFKRYKYVYKNGLGNAHPALCSTFI